MAYLDEQYKRNSLKNEYHVALWDIDINSDENRYEYRYGFSDTILQNKEKYFQLNKLKESLDNAIRAIPRPTHGNGPNDFKSDHDNINTKIEEMKQLHYNHVKSLWIKFYKNSRNIFSKGYKPLSYTEYKKRYPEWAKLIELNEPPKEIYDYGSFVDTFVQMNFPHVEPHVEIFAGRISGL